MKEKGEALDNLNKRWLNLWERAQAAGNAQEVFKELTARYREPHRFYHTLAHLEDCLSKFEEVNHLVLEKEAVEFAIWFHDAVYVPGAKDNEEQSAALAKEALKNALLPEVLGRRVASLILATKHSFDPKDFDTQILVDIDLSILGETKEKFDQYEAQIRQEYVSLSDEVFRQGRLRILKTFLERSNLYSTQFFHQKYEVQARRNIAESILNLNAKLS